MNALCKEMQIPVGNATGCWLLNHSCKLGEQNKNRKYDDLSAVVDC